MIGRVHARVGLVFGVGPVIVEIWMRVGSCEEDACCEKSDGQDRAAKFWKACSCGINGRNAEKASLVSSERLEILFKWLVSSSSSKFVSLIDWSPNMAVSTPNLPKSGWLQGLPSLEGSSLSKLSYSSLSEK